jgi:hypothetical protein
MITWLKGLLLVLALFPSVALASPFLVCDPYSPADQVTNFQVTIDAAAPVDSAPVNNALKYDLANISFGSHTVKVKACNIWGCSEDSAPFTFIKQLPGAPQNVTITK